MEWIVIIGYAVGLSVICLFSLEQLYLSILYLKAKKKKISYPTISHYPKVTVQLPVYNEKYVVERLIDSVCQLVYPKEQLEIQVLDDSTDDTIQLIQNQVELWKSKGINIHHVQRPNRVGYKAGALAYGLEETDGEFICVFDSDFMPKADFLKKMLPAFDEHTGMVQARWGHINENYNLLTRTQAFGLNAHFTVEQNGRNATGKLINFNGTAGIWRKQCIVEAGGWQYDTLTEDLDLSYRAQLKGWKFKYLEDVLAPAELPVLVSAVKSQQYRWNKGAAETARKNIWAVLTSKLSRHEKLHAAFHLLNSSVFIFLLVASLLSIPMLYIKDAKPELSLVFNLASVFIIGFIAMIIFYWTSARASDPTISLKKFMFQFPVFLSLSLGMTLHNTIAVIEGYLGIKTPFIRTPKFNISSKEDSWKGNLYLTKFFTPITFFEGLLTLYFLFGIVSAFLVNDFGLILFHLMLAAGFGAVFILSLKPIGYAEKQ